MVGTAQLPVLSRFRPVGASVKKDPHIYRTPVIWKAPERQVVKIGVYGKTKYLRPAV
jgi:hypothetical protein